MFIIDVSEYIHVWNATEVISDEERVDDVML